MGRCLSSSPRFFFSAGGIPYGGMALGTAYYAREAVNLAASGENASQALEMLHTVQSFQITYGAVMLSFLGAIHWGMEFAKLGGRPAAPKWYSTYRFYLTSIAGGSILLSLFALNQWDVASPAMATGHGGRHPAYPSAGQGKITMAKSELERIGAKVERGGAEGGFLAIEKVPTTEERKQAEKEAKAKAAKEKKAEKEKAAAGADDDKKKSDAPAAADGADKKGSATDRKPAAATGQSSTDEKADDTAAADKKSGKEAPGDSKLAQGQEADQAPGRTEQQDAKRDEKAAGSKTPATSG
jgi:hypothetical protein